MLVNAIPLATILTLVVLFVAFAQPTPWRLVQIEDGSVYLIHDGIRQRIVIPMVPSEEVASLIEGEPILEGQLPVTNPAVGSSVQLPAPTLSDFEILNWRWERQRDNIRLIGELRNRGSEAAESNFKPLLVTPME